jgi:hypothetical protein
MIALASKGRSWIPQPLRRGAAILLGALFISWPAFYNGFPLLYPDSISYLDDGRLVARALFLHRLAGYYGGRSFIYCLGILPFHWNQTAWPVVALQCLLTAWILFLVVRSIAPRRPVLPYLVIVLTLSALTGMSWYAAMVMPDIFGPLLYLAVYLLVFARDSLTRAERWSLYLFAWWAVAAHATHMMLGCALCLLLLVTLLITRRTLRPIAEFAAILALAAAAQLALHGYLYGKPSLFGKHPPFLTARIIADGPGRWYLQEHCAQLPWVICKHLDHLPDDADTFLWAPDGIWQTNSKSENQLLAEQEMPFVLATLRAYPLAQLERSTESFAQQLVTFGYDDLDANDWVLAQFPAVLPPALGSYQRSRQARNQLPLDSLDALQNWTVALSLAAFALLAPFLRRLRSPRLAGLSLIVVSMTLANAWITATLSMVEDRLQCRVVWLLPLLAALSALAWIESRRGSAIRP